MPFKVKKGKTPMFRKKSPATKNARFNFSKKRANTNYKFSKKIANFAETKLIPLERKNEIQPVNIQLGALATVASFVVGNPPTGWTTQQFSTLGGIATTRGDQSNQRDGAYTYLKKTTATMEIDMLDSGVRTPQEFRVIVCKQRRGVTPANYDPDYAETLFLNESGRPTGHLVTGIDGTDLMCQPLNKRLWYIHKDMKFRMSPPLDTGATNGYTGYYPTMKRIMLDMPHYKKTRYAYSGLNNATEPSDYDFNWLIVVYSRSLDKDANANGYEINMRGTTSFNDV